MWVKILVQNIKVNSRISYRKNNEQCIIKFNKNGGTAVWTARNSVEADYKTVCYSGKELDAMGLYYYGYRYYQPWAGRWLSADPAGTVDGLNLFRMCRNNQRTLRDEDGLASLRTIDHLSKEDVKDIKEAISEMKDSTE